MHMTYLLAIVQCTGPTGLVLYVPEQPPKTRKLDTLEYSTINQVIQILDGWLRMGLLPPPPLGNFADISYLVEN